MMDNNMISLTVLAAAAFVGFVIAALSGKTIVPWLHRLHFGQTIRDEGPAWHRKKQGTPTMGALLFLLGGAVAFLLALVVCEWLLPVKVLSATPVTRVRLFAGIGMALCCGAIGFADDYIKVVKKRNLGLTSSQKFTLQVIVGVGYGLMLYFRGATELYVPFCGVADWGIWMVPFAAFVVVAMSNATNLTDGIDGLCGTVTLIATLCLLVAAGLSEYFGQALLASAFAGGLAGFLVWNLHPARVFMGDTGSLMIGGLLCGIAFGIGQPFLLVPVGIVYIIEVLSVCLQVGYFKLTHGKRLFKMSPIHHHFELCGWSENRIVITAAVVTLICGIAGLLLVL